MKKLIAILSLVLLLPLSLDAQGGYRDEYEKFKKQAKTTYSSFREQCNQEYAEFLKQAWTYYRIGPVIEKPKEEEVPPVVIKDEEKTPPVEDNELPYDEVVPVPVVEPQPQPIEPVIPTPVVEEGWYDFNFFGTTMKVRADEKNKFSLKSIKSEDVAKGWKRLSGKEYDNMLADCLKIRSDYKLSDWAYLLLLLSFADAFLGSYNEDILMTAYLYCQSGYKMRLATNGDELCLLFGTKHQIYGLAAYSIDGYYYYQLNGEEKELRIANFTFPKEQPLSLAISELPLFNRDESETRTITSERYATAASCSVNMNLIEFYGYYPSSQLDNNPMTRWALYANTPIDATVKSQLYPSLKKAIDGKSVTEAADILLDFVQTGFEYEYDDKVWGTDRAFFGEESLFYPYCDCEDRSILYSHLVRDLLGLDVILVYYPGHLATAVKFTEPVNGDYIAYNGGKYAVCDPTYIGAPIGLTMPDMDNKTAKVILLKK